jgi:hypothetical protein
LLAHSERQFQLSYCLHKHAFIVAGDNETCDNSLELQNFLRFLLCDMFSSMLTGNLLLGISFKVSVPELRDALNDIVGVIAAC